MAQGSWAEGRGPAMAKPTLSSVSICPFVTVSVNKIMEKRFS